MRSACFVGKVLALTGALFVVTAACASVWPTSGTYAVLKTADHNADSLYANSLSGDAKTAVTGDADYGKGFFASSLTASSKVNRWTLYTDGQASSESPTAAVFPPNANYDYWVTDRQLCSPNGGTSSTGTYAFSGRSLTFADGAIFSHCSKGSTVVDLGSDVRVLGVASYAFPARSTADPQSKGTFALASGARLEVRENSAGDLKTTYGLQWIVTGDETTSIRFGCSKAGTSETSANWRWRGDASGFLGTIELLSPATGQVDRLSVYAPIGGTIKVLDRAEIIPAASYATAPIANLVLAAGGLATLGSVAALEADSVVVADGGVIDARAENFLPLVARTSFAAEGKVRVLIPSAGTTRTILTVPADCAIAGSSFVFAHDADGDTLQFAIPAWTDNGDGTRSLTVRDCSPSDSAGTSCEITGSSILTTADERVRVTVASGATLSLALDGDSGDTPDERMVVKGSAGSVIRVGRTEPDWSAVPLLWLDASDGHSLSNIVITYSDSSYNYEHTPLLEVGQTICDSSGNPYVKGWMDCRDSRQTLKMWNNRYDNPYGTTHNVMWSTHPRRVIGGLEGKDYIAFDRPKKDAVWMEAGKTYSVTNTSGTGILPRLYFQPYSMGISDYSLYWLYPRYAFVVYGSQEGGGGALLGGNASFLRAGTVGSHTKDDAIFAANAASARVWIDGTEVDPTTTGFSGGWQVVTVDFMSTTNAFSGLGYGASNASDNGGQRYAEVILVDRELTERQRQTIEIYLAEKWGLASHYAYPQWSGNPTATVYGEGTVSLVHDAALSGSFSGTIELNGRELTIDGSSLPPDATAVDTADLTGWYDPDAAGSVVEEESGSAHRKAPSKRVTWLYDRRCGSTALDGYYALTGNGTDRSPWLDRSAHDLGPVRKWIDYSNVSNIVWANTTSNGNTMRFRVASGGKWTGDVVTNAFRTIVMAQDSKYGGGQPFVDGNSVLPSDQSQLYKVRSKQKAASPIYPSGTAAVLTEGLTRLNGVAVNGSTTGFRGRGEILAVQPTGAYGNVCFDVLHNSEQLDASNTRAAVQGEILMWNRVLGSEELARAEAYLAWKWLGIVQAGYSALTNATITGSGTVKASSLAVLPKFASTSTANVIVAGESQTFTYADGSIVDARDLGGAKLSLPASVAVTVSFGSRVRSGVYPLVSCGGGLNGTEFSLDVPSALAQRLSLVKTDEVLSLRVAQVGLMMIVK